MNFKELYYRINTASVLNHAAASPVVEGLKTFLFAIENADAQFQTQCYGSFVNAIYEEGGDLSQAILRMVLEDENFYVKERARGNKPAAVIAEALEQDLALFQEISQLRPEDLGQAIEGYQGFLPRWTVSPVDIAAEYHSMLSGLSSTGYGIFAKYNGFTVKDGQLVPILHMDDQKLESLYGYTRERNLVLENTRALVEGGKACNVLLYGDAGTGKSSTIKAVARHFFDQGLRIVEFKKNQLEDILPIMESLSLIPLKFIFYIDDLSFSAGDDTFCALKGILEGSAASYAGNIAIYATSNRRHLIKESMDDRVGDSLHVNDTLQETMSLAARFGLTVTFSKPEKDLYLEIVKNLAAEYGIDMPEEILFRKAEAFAIRQNGRSPRTAKQFLQLTKIGL